MPGIPRPPARDPGQGRSLGRAGGPFRHVPHLCQARDVPQEQAANRVAPTLRANAHGGVAAIQRQLDLYLGTIPLRPCPAPFDPRLHGALRQGAGRIRAAPAVLQHLGAGTAGVIPQQGLLRSPGASRLGVGLFVSGRVSEPGQRLRAPQERDGQDREREDRTGDGWVPV